MRPNEWGETLLAEKKKILGDERRHLILEWLQNSREPITGGELAKRTNVSRQIIVNDITLLKAKNEPILATSQGYLYIHPAGAENKVEKTLVCMHSREQVAHELNLLVDHGVTVKDVKVEHPVYGDLTASIMVSTRAEVARFIRRIEETNASYLSELTGGIHLHTVEAASGRQVEEAEQALKEAGILFAENEKELP
ncbi:transcription repressor NadR [Heyndrickxia faecalis]|jgi:transcriptional regulator of NAD metabolism|uniref:transcription repressor NadR n=1 Tax=Heyndrickxia TaxID=2837504 RepID=UPI000A86AEA6|nr:MULTISPECIES: transcription repressor NadR [Heyndrickxia]MED4866029.1 transcription repressor NadR [Weizmannia sp. CD-2023]MED4921029.1 transcription repressor NadR [Weizmannia sp. CD-2023]